MFTEEEVRKATLEYFEGDELATDVWMKKYALRDKEDLFLESYPDETIRRVTKEFARIEKKYPNPLSEKEIYEALRGFKYIVPQGSPLYGIGNNYSLSSLANCVVARPPEDNISSIFESGRDLANLTKRRCGVGTDLSLLRPEGTGVNNSAKTTSGAWSFADYYSNVARMIGQGNRRAALLISLDGRHPDVEKFASMKKDLKKVVGANVSIKIYDDFMKAALNDEEYELRWPVEGPAKVTRKIKAKELWKHITKLARDTAEPGILFWSRIISYCPASSYPRFKAVSTNACSELPLCVNDGCRLLLLNLKSFVDSAFEAPQVNFKKLRSMTHVAQRLLDDLVDLEMEKIEKIIKVCDTQDEKQIWQEMFESARDGRRTGLSITGLADMFAELKLCYDSSEAIAVADEVFNTIKTSAYESSVTLAKERGVFPAFKWELEKDNEFILSLSKELQKEIRSFGRRNISILTCSPAGSISLLTQTSSGIEPVFQNSYTRKRKTNSEEKTIGKEDLVGDKWVEYEVKHSNLTEYQKKFNTTDIPEYFVSANEIDWKRRVEMQSVIQKHIDHSISSTINLPESTTAEQVEEIYTYAWEKGLKGITVYREGSRDAVLFTSKEKAKQENGKTSNPFNITKAPKRPLSLKCDIHRAKIKGEEWTIFVGLLDSKPYEIFAGLSDLVEIPTKHTTGIIEKTKFKSRSRYDLVYGEDATKIKDIAKVFNNPTEGVMTRLISLSLRHGSSPSFIVEQLNRSEDGDFSSFAKVIARILKRYINDGVCVCGGDSICQECGQKLVYEGGCAVCKTCGYSKCG